MKVLRFESREAWLNARLGMITGSTLKDIVSTKGRKIGSYRIVAESIIGSAALAEEEDTNAMERGTRLEKDAIERFHKETKKRVDDSLILWVRDDDPRIGLSPDGVVGKHAAVEAKCLSAARHAEALIEHRIPADYLYQRLQYFIVNDDLRELFFVFYDPRFPAGLDFLVITVKRKDVQAEVDQYLAYEREELKWVREQVNRLTFYSPEEIACVQTVQKELQSDEKKVHSKITKVPKAKEAA